MRPSIIAYLVFSFSPGYLVYLGEIGRWGVLSGYSSVAIEGPSGKRSVLLLLEELMSRIRRHASQTGILSKSPICWWTSIYK